MPLPLKRSNQPAPRTAGRRRVRGFTIMELLIALVIVAIITSLGAPSFNRLIRTTRVQGASASLMGGLSAARAEAIRTGFTVRVCASDDPSATPPVCGNDWSLGWVIFTDLNNDQDPSDTVNIGGRDIVEYVVKVGDPAPNVAVTSLVAEAVVFDGRGRALTGADSYTFDSVDCTSGVDKQVTISVTSIGQARMASGTCP